MSGRREWKRGCDEDIIHCDILKVDASLSTSTVDLSSLKYTVNNMLCISLLGCAFMHIYMYTYE